MNPSQGKNESEISLLSSSVPQKSLISKSKSERFTTETTIKDLCTPPVNCSIQRELFFKKRESYLRSQNIFYEILDELLYELTIEEMNPSQGKNESEISLLSSIKYYCIFFQIIIPYYFGKLNPIIF